jgi:(2Fe-2S) ferredoxin
MSTHATDTPAVTTLTSREAFNRYRTQATERYQRMMSAADRPVISIVMSECTRAKGVEGVIASFTEQIAARGVDVEIREVGCFGNCYAEPVVEVRKAGWPAVMYGYVTTDDVPAILDGIQDDRANVAQPLGGRAEAGRLPGHPADQGRSVLAQAAAHRPRQGGSDRSLAHR